MSNLKYLSCLGFFFILFNSSITFVDTAQAGCTTDDGGCTITIVGQRIKREDYIMPGKGAGGLSWGGRGRGGNGGFFSGNGGTSAGDSDDGKGEEDECEGNPIMVQSGNKMQFETDYIGKGEFPLTISRTYNKAWVGSGLFGEKWISDYGHKLTFVAATGSSICQLVINELPEYSCEQQGSTSQNYSQIIAYRPDGRKFQFTYNPFIQLWEDYKAESVQKLELIGNEWFLTTESEVVERYDITGKLLQRTSPAGLYHKFIYNGDSLISVNHSSGRNLTFTRTANQLTRITDSAGNHYDYTYNSSGYLASVVRPGTPTLRKYYYYEDGRFPGALTRIRVGNNDFAYFSYHADGRGKSTYHRGGVENFSFSYGFNSTTVTNPFDHDSTYRYKTVNGRKLLDKTDRAAATYCPAASSNVTYDTNGYVDLKTDWKGNITDYDYNAKGQLIKQTEAALTSLAKVTEYQWLAGENKIVQQSNAYSKVVYAYTSQGRLASMVATNRGSYGNYGETRKTTFSYISNSKGIVTKRTVDGPRTDVNDTTIYDFDVKGNLIKVTNALGHITSLSEYDALGNVGRIIDPNGLQTNLTYDAAGRILTKNILNSSGTQTTKYKYNNLGKIRTIVYPDYHFISFNYDLAHRLIQTSNNDGDVISYGYNNNSDISSTVISEQTTTTVIPPGCWDGGGGSPLGGGGSTFNLMVRIVDPCDPVTTITEIDYFAKYTDYDAMGRLHRTIGNNGQNTVYNYDDNSNIKSITDAAGNATNMTYNALNQLTGSTAADGGLTRYGYDSAGRVARVTDARSLSTRYYYSGFGDLIKLNSPDTGITQYTYNQSGQVLSMRRNDGSITYYTYDALGRVKSKSNSSETKNYSYDFGTNKKGRLHFISDGNNNTTVFAYDKVGNITQKSSKVDGKSYFTHYAYDRMNRVTQITYPSSHKVNYSYNSAGNVEKVTYQNGSTIQNVASYLKYRPFGPLKSMIFGNLIFRSISHDLDYRPTKIYSSGIQDLNYRFDSKNNITKITNNQVSRLTQNYRYDTENRLTRVIHNLNIQSYSYDRVGNRTSDNDNGLTKTLTYSTSSNQLTNITGNSGTVQYNNNGQTINKGGITFNYSKNNRLSSATNNGQTTSYLYNGLGQRTKKTGINGSSHYLYNEQGQLIAEHNATGTVQKEYIYLQGQVIGMIKANVLYYVHNDHLGRAERITNQTKNTVWQASNYAFDRTVSANTIGDYNLGFPGQYWDEEKGSWYNYFRDYDSTTGRYLQSDPIGLGGGINTYGYVGGNPVGFVDPFGLNPRYQAAGVCALVAVTAFTFDFFDLSSNIKRINENPHVKSIERLNRAIEENNKAIDECEDSDIDKKMKISIEGIKLVTLRDKLLSEGLNLSGTDGAIGLTIAAIGGVCGSLFR